MAPVAEAFIRSYMSLVSQDCVVNAADIEIVINAAISIGCVLYYSDSSKGLHIQRYGC